MDIRFIFSYLNYNMNSIYKLLFCTVAVLGADSNTQSPKINLDVNNRKYNILSLESSMYKGYMQSKFLEYIEMRSYTIATRESNKNKI